MPKKPLEALPPPGSLLWQQDRGDGWETVLSLHEADIHTWEAAKTWLGILYHKDLHLIYMPGPWPEKLDSFTSPITGIQHRIIQDEPHDNK